MSDVSNTSLQDKLFDLFLYFGSEWVLELLVILSVISLVIAIERCLHFLLHRDKLAALRDELDQLLNRGDLEGAKKRLESSRSYVAKVALDGLLVFERGPATIEETMRSSMKLARLKMERGLIFLGTLGNNAPFIGLFGTVLGIIRAFRDLALNTSEGSTAVMAGIAEALVATAVGLMVALPSVAIFNFFQRAIRRRAAMSDALGHILLAHAKSISNSEKAA